jgi:cellobionic acid phosphorylase
MHVVRQFRGATFDVTIRRTGGDRIEVRRDGELLAAPRVTGIEAGRCYRLEVGVP